MYVGWIFAGSVCAAAAVALLGLGYVPGYFRIPFTPNVKGDVELARLYLQLLPLILPSIGMLVVAALLAATEGRRSDGAGQLMHASGGSFMLAYLLLATGANDGMKVGGVMFFLAWVLLALSTVKFAPSNGHKH